MQQRFMILYFVAREVSSILPACAADSCFSSWIWTDAFLLQYHTNSNTGHGSVDLYAQQFCPVNACKYLLYYCTIVLTNKKWCHSPVLSFSHQILYVSPAIHFGHLKLKKISGRPRPLRQNRLWQLPSMNQLGLSDKDQKSLIWKKNKIEGTKMGLPKTT